METEDDVIVPRDIYPSQAGENRQLPLKFSKTNGFHRIFHHESIWEEKGEGKEGVRAFCTCLSSRGADLEGSLAKLFKAVPAASRTYPRKTFWQVCEVCCKVQYNVVSTKGISGQPRMSIDKELVKLFYVLYMNVYISTS